MNSFKCPFYRTILSTSSSRLPRVSWWTAEELERLGETYTIVEKEPCLGIVEFLVKNEGDCLKLGWFCNFQHPRRHVRRDLPFDVSDLRDWIGQQLKKREEPSPPKTVMTFWEQVKLDWGEQ